MRKRILIPCAVLPLYRLLASRAGAVTIGVGALFGLAANAVGDAAGDPVPVDVAPGSVTVIPEPATLLMLAPGLALLAARPR